MEKQWYDNDQESQNLKHFQDYPSFDNGIIDDEMMDPVMPVQQASAPVMPDTLHNYDRAIVPGTIDSRSFTQTEAEWQRSRSLTQTEAEWQRVPESASTVNYVDSTASRNYDREEKTGSFFHTLLAFFASIIVAGVLAFINVMVYNIEYISTLQVLMSMLPPMFLFTVFYNMTGKRAMTVLEGMLLIIFNGIISYIMFHAVMAHNMQKIYSELTFKEAWQFVNVMKAVTEMQRIYYLHFALIFGISFILGIFFGIMGIKGILDGGGAGRWRH